jgi:hypothetical protein
MNSDRVRSPAVASTPASPVRRAAALASDTLARVERRLAKRYSDVELRQLKAMERAYSGVKGPELLMFGESNMVWTVRDEADRRHLAEMIRDELGGHIKLQGMVGPGYNPRIIMAMLSALPRCASRPSVVIVPMSILMATTNWLSHPVLGYERAGKEVRDLIAIGGQRPRRLTQPTTEEWETYDHLPAPSLIGARRTVGELRLVTAANPETRWQQAIRLRHLMDSYNAEQLEPDGIGVKLVAEMASMIREQKLHSVAYIPPINIEVCVKVLGEGSRAHIERNAQLLADAYQEAAGETGTVVNAVDKCQVSDFADPLHLSESGRRHLASMIAGAIRPLL